MTHAHVSHVFNGPTLQGERLDSPVAVAPRVQSEQASRLGLQTSSIPLNPNELRPGLNLPQSQSQSQASCSTDSTCSTITEPRGMLVDRAEILVKLKLHIKEKYKTSKVAAAAWKCTPSFVSSVHKRLRPPNKAMLDALGYVRTEVYSPIPPNFSNSSNGLQGATDNTCLGIGDSS